MFVVVMSSIHKGLGLGLGLTGMTREFKGVYEEKFEGGVGLGVVWMYNEIQYCHLISTFIHSEEKRKSFNW